MDIREYIESGAIELYVMNALSDAEAAEVESLALQYPEILAEIDEVQSVMQIYAQTFAQIPRPELKDQILDKIKAEMPQTNLPQGDAPITPSSPNSFDQATGLPHLHKTSIVSKGVSFLSILPWVAVLGLAASTFYFYQINQKTIKAKMDCEQSQNLTELKNRKAIADLNLKLDVLKSVDTKTIPLKSVVKTEKDYIATVYWNATKKTTYLTIQNLPEPPADKQYQLWAIVNGKPVDAGVFEYNLNALQTMNGFEDAQAFAVTLEPEGGSKEPTLNKMYVLGTL